jgi:hypothetical protein
MRSAERWESGLTVDGRPRPPDPQKMEGHISGHRFIIVGFHEKRGMDNDPAEGKVNDNQTAKTRETHLFLGFVPDFKAIQFMLKTGAGPGPYQGIGAGTDAAAATGL